MSEHSLTQVHREVLSANEDYLHRLATKAIWPCHLHADLPS